VIVKFIFRKSQIFRKIFIIPAPTGLFIPTVKKYSYIQGVIPTTRR